MSLFGKMKAAKAPSVPVENSVNENILSKVQILGAGCPNCRALEKATQEALADLGLDPVIEHVTDFTEIVSYGVMTTPGLVLDGKVVSYGRVLNKDQVRDLIKKEGF